MSGRVPAGDDDFNRGGESVAQPGSKIDVAHVQKMIESHPQVFASFDARLQRILQARAQGLSVEEIAQNEQTTPVSIRPTIARGVNRLEKNATKDAKFSLKSAPVSGAHYLHER